MDRRTRQRGLRIAAGRLGGQPAHPPAPGSTPCSRCRHKPRTACHPADWPPAGREDESRRERSHENVRREFLDQRQVDFGGAEALDAGDPWHFLDLDLLLQVEQQQGAAAECTVDRGIELPQAVGSVRPAARRLEVICGSTRAKVSPEVIKPFPTRVSPVPFRQRRSRRCRHSGIAMPAGTCHCAASTSETGRIISSRSSRSWSLGCCCSLGTSSRASASMVGPSVCRICRARARRHWVVSRAPRLATYRPSSKRIRPTSHPSRDLGSAIQRRR